MKSHSINRSKSIHLTITTESTPPAFPPEFRKKLNVWFRRHGRELPWRQTHDPYAIWVSEIMLQQTQVATVIDYYTRFLQRFPDAATLAEAPEQDVLNLWAGLGYYRRARQLHAAAKVISQQHAGVFPNQLATIMDLPGVGRYTAGAIASFAFDRRAPIVEANTRRLYCRLLAHPDQPTTAASQTTLWNFAESLLPSGRGSGAVNQALIELGSQVCTPKKPACQACPVNGFCKSYELGLQHRIPPAAPKKEFEERIHGMLIISNRGRWLVRQNTTGQWWQGLWEFPRADLTHLGIPKQPEKLLKASTDAVQTAFAQQLELDCDAIQPAHSLKHAVTKYKILLHCFTAELASSQNPTTALPGTWRWLAPTDTDLPLSAPAQKLRTLISG